MSRSQALRLAAITTSVDGGIQIKSNDGHLDPVMESPFTSSTVSEADPVKNAGDGTDLMNWRTRALRGLGWSYLAVIGKILLTFLVLAVLSRLLTPGDFGLLGIAWIFVELASQFGLGIGQALIQRSELTGRHLEVGFTLSVALGVAMAAAMWLLAPHFGAFFDEPGVVSSILQVLSLSLVIIGVGVVPEHLLRRNLRFRELMVANLLAYSVGYGITAVALALQGFGVWALVWGEVTRTLIYTMTVAWYSPPRFLPRLAACEATDLVSRGAGLSFSQVLHFIEMTGGHFVVGRWLGAVSLGYYTRADRLASLPFAYIGSKLFEVMLPVLSRRQKQADSLRVVYLHGVEILWLLLLSLSALIFVSAPESVSVVLGGQWDETVPVLQLLALAIPFQNCAILNIAVIRASGTVYRETWRRATNAFLVVLGAWLGSRWGLTGVAAAIISAQFVAYLLMTQAACSLLGLRWRPLQRCCLPALWAGAWTTFTLWLTAGWLRALALPDALVLFFEILIWVTAVGAAIFCAPPFTRPASVPWMLAHVPFEALGSPGQYLRSGLKRLPAPRH